MATMMTKESSHNGGWWGLLAAMHGHVMLQKLSPVIAMLLISCFGKQCGQRRRGVAHLHVSHPSVRFYRL